MTTTFLNAKIGEVENEIPDHAKYIATLEFNKFTGSIFNKKLKQAVLAAGSDVNCVSQCANKKKEKIEKLQMFNLRYFLCKFSKYVCFSTNISLIGFKQSNEYKVSPWKSEGVYTFKLFPLRNLSPIIKYL